MTAPSIHAPGVQAPGAVLMVRPHRFRPNPETSADNVFQAGLSGSDEVAAHAARAEFDAVVERLRDAGVSVHVFEDDGERDTPDSVFPNNWISTHAGGHVALYPMHAPSRRRERRADIVEMLKTRYRVQDVIDYSGLEMDGLFLEGTGAMVLDHLGRVAYVARSNRADPIVLERFCTHFGFEPIAFDAQWRGAPVYHTNVLMTVATAFALVGLDTIVDPERVREVCDRLEATGRHLLRVDDTQIGAFVGNAIELTSRSGRVLALSETARRALRPDQVRVIEDSAELLPIPVPTIERAGGSIRCMIAGIHLAPRPRCPKVEQGLSLPETASVHLSAATNQQEASSCVSA